jgi:KDO2-lipid IV(A) lauroyltransferase
MVTLHLGNFDLVGQLLAMRGLKLTVPVERMHPEALFDLLVRLRGANGINIVPIERAPREMIAALRRGEIVGLAGDRGAGGKTVPVTLFGRQTAIPRGAVALARRARAPLVVAIGVRVSEDSFRGYVTPPVSLTYKPGEENELRDAQALADAFAPFIERFPDQWLAFTPMWPHSDGGNRAGTIWATNRGGVSG